MDDFSIEVFADVEDDVDYSDIEIEAIPPVYSDSIDELFASDAIPEIDLEDDFAFVD
jgi:hypothetical protein